ncbi:hypothetical protein PVK06_000123 [Gossypium arboreum]|uniref:Peptidase C14 caspase domain-containing protein n=1 Tax=Gossypium arboreum TaxID=29729 RepID=A0ABR0QXD1_GOSAR|nr:hypothetical protein PVK06_000123 [Gossypium arboreum]
MVIKIVCLRCRQKLTVPAYAEKITCGKCGEVNPIIKKPSPATSLEQGKISKPMEKLKKLLLGNTQRLSDSSGSSSSPPSKLCALDESGNQPPAKKRAVLCGVSYKKWKYKLKGTINDVMNMKTLLTQTYGFLERNILVLTALMTKKQYLIQPTEEESDTRLIPTKANIETCLKWLVNGCQKGDSLVFYYSGHGLRQPDFNQDERDGFDETICPVDFLREGMIVDNDIYATIVKPLSEGVTLHAIVDACHSGTILDLEHVYERDKRMWVDNSPPSGVRKKTSGGIAYSISACEDNQIAADTSVNPIIKKPSPVISDEMIIKIVCHRCRQKLTAPAYAEKITCPHCGQVNPIIKKPSPVTSRDQGKISPPLICKPMEKLKRLLLGNTQRLSDSSGSSSSPPSKLCSLDYCGNHPAKKRAVLCGVSYKKGKYKLEGPINDVMNMKTLLTQTYGFPERNILVLTEEESDIRLIPTKANIETCLKWLVNDCQKGDSLVFFYSGHGSQQPDFNQDERDGFDETICPVNFLREGMIVDNDIYATIVKPLSEGVTLHAIVDACHSGTILDLEHVYERDKRMWVDNSPPSGVRKKTSGGIAYSISACEDYQVAADTSML